MGLKSYHQKRDFKKTPEPRGRKKQGEKHRFIIQKHAASHLHYDFRLELDGVLKSWAVPKGPCLDPKVKRLAIHVEDHPVEYGNFEGIIPKGQYGGGTVMLWDRGKWLPLDADPDKAYAKGHLRFYLEAEKLHGRWDLFRLNNEEKSWFLVKYNDEFSKPLENYDITVEEPNSVLTEQSLDEIAENYEAIWTSKEKKSSNAIVDIQAIDKLIPSDLKTSPFPESITPQLATLADTPPNGEEWIHEVKFDGYRIIAFKKNKHVRLMSRNNIEWTKKFPNVVEALQELPMQQVILDGEIILLDDNHRSSFQLLQNAMQEDKKYPFIFYLFDVLYYNKWSLKQLPLLQRKEILEHILPKDHPILKYSDHIVGHGKAVFEKSCKAGLEGIISKQGSSTYLEKRTKTWLKLKCIQRQEFVIGGYSKPQRSREYFGSLFLGYFNDDGELVYSGNVGTGFTEASLKSIYQELRKYRSDKNPFTTTPPKSKEATWVKPHLLAEIEFSEWTDEGRLRHPSFKGLREDKNSSSVGKETMDKTTNLTNPQKILYPEDKISKQDLYRYYEEVSDFILPYIKERPLTLVRCPHDYKECFYQRHFYKSMPKTLCSLPIKNKDDDKSEQYIYLRDKEGLFSLAQIGVLEIHPWGSRIENIEYPDMITIDLDPGPNVLWKEIVVAAFEVKKHLESFQLTCFVKTTGGKGLHVVIPIQPEYAWDEVKNFTHVFVQFLEKINPEQYVTNMAKSKRVGKIFIDYLRNQRGATSVSAYSPRARIHAPVAVPLHWDELTSDSKDTYYTIYTLPKRLQTLREDPWQGFWQIKQSLRLNDL